MQQSVHIRHDHGANDEWHRLGEGIFPPTSLTPHRPKNSEEKSRKPHRGIIHIHRKIASTYSDHQRLYHRYSISDAPKHHHIDGKMEEVSMTETIQEVIPPWATLIEANMQEEPTQASKAKN